MNRGNILAVSGLVLAGMVMAPRLTRGAPIIPRQMAGVFRAGAFAQDITPEHFPIMVNGNFKPKFVEKALDPLHARCLVLDDGRGPIAMAVVDSCVLDREVMDEAKRLASGMTGIPAGRIFISATHTHSAPAAVSILGTDHDPRYRAWLPGKIAEGIRNAMGRREPVQVGWAVEKLPEVVQSRRWIARPDRIKRDPFGEFTTRATMHPGRRNPDWEEPSGPMNPDVNVLAVRRLDGRTAPELTAVTTMPARAEKLWIGGTAEGEAGFEGRCDEVAVYASALTAEDVAAHYRAACGSVSGGGAGR